MPGLLVRYTNWLHTCWPAGAVEKLPEIREDGSTNVPGVYVAGDLTGIPLLKFSLETGARAARAIAADPGLRAGGGEPEGMLDLVIIGAGVSGMAAAMEARKHRLRFEVLEASEPFATVVNFPKGKPIYTYPREMTPQGDLQVNAAVKEPLLEELREQVARAGLTVRPARAERIERRDGRLLVHLGGGATVAARRVLIAIGRSGNYRRLGVPGESLEKVYNRLHDPHDFAGRDVLVVGGGDSALEAAVALAQGAARVTLSYRRPELSRPKPENLERIAALERPEG